MPSCKQCQAPFEITKSDLAFYDKASPVIAGKKYQIPAPSLCSECRTQRRFTWRNERHLYKRKCDLSGKEIMSNFSPDKDIKAYELSEWWSDKWDATTYGREFDFSRSFFEQFADVQQDVPQLGASVWNSENSDYCCYAGHVKNSYLIFGSVYCEDCYYGSPYYSKNCVDTLVVRECENCYECTDCRKLYGCFYCQDCWDSDSLIYCYDLQGCSDCIGCAGLRRKKFCVFNEQLSEEEYKKKKKQELNFCSPETHRKLQKELSTLKTQIPHRFMQSNKVENVSGNYVYESKNIHNSFFADRSEDCKYCAQVVDLKDCYDNNYTEENEVCCEYLGAYQNARTSFSKFCNKVHDALYSDACHNADHLFGCIGIRSNKYCILNKQYTEEEYNTLVPKIIEHMMETKEWGEFFPAEMSPFAYNETVASEYFPLTKEEVLRKKLHWKDDIDQIPEVEKIIPADRLPASIDDIPEDVLNWAIKCGKTERPFQIVKQELSFYRKHKLPIPHFHPDVRHEERMKLRNPRKLWTRECGKCSKEIQTSYAPERPEKVLCEECYLKEVY